MVYFCSTAALDGLVSANRLPAACQVEPAVSSLRSSSTTSFQPALARGSRMAQPGTPPPITTTRAWVSIFNSVLQSERCEQVAALLFRQLRERRADDAPVGVLQDRGDRGFQRRHQRIALEDRADLGYLAVELYPRVAVRHV